MRIQLWSYNYDPEPTGIAPVSTTWVRAMKARGHEMSVVSAHPHYPEPVWGARLTPSREVREGVPVLRLPIWSGRDTTAARLRQEASYATVLSAAVPFLGTPDVIVAVSPSFPALVPAMLAARARKVPWVLWLQDILPDGAEAAGMLTGNGAVVTSARRLELAAYSSANRIVVISDTFSENLRGKGVPPSKIVRVYNLASHPVLDRPRAESDIDPATVMTMGNIGRSQNLRAIVEAFQASNELRELGARFQIVGHGVARDEVEAAVRSDRVEIAGLVPQAELEDRLRRATVACVGQKAQREFNVPSKLMNFMAHGIPTVASVSADSEVARLIEHSQAGWVATDPDAWAKRVAQALRAPALLRQAGARALCFAREEFAPDKTAADFEEVLADLTR